MSTSIKATRGAEFWAGVKDTFPLMVGAIPFGIIFGAVASTSGLSAGGTMAMSLFVFAGSAQFIAANLIHTGTSVAVIILTTFVVNLRHTLYAATLAPHMKNMPQRWLLPLGFWLTDESFVVVISRYTKTDSSPYKHWYFLGSEIGMYSNWNLCTLLGVVAGQKIQNPQSWGLDFAMIVTFIGMTMPFIRSRPALASVLVAGVVAVLTYSLPNKLGLIIAALLGVLAGVVAEARWPQPLDGIKAEKIAALQEPLS